MNRPQGDPDPLPLLRDEFRRHLEVFYAGLQLAPPYHSVEKAIAHLVQTLNTMVLAERAALADDQAQKWALFRQAFVESGLNQKHRGIIAGLARSRSTLNLPPEYDHFLNACRS